MCRVSYGLGVQSNRLGVQSDRSFTGSWQTVDGVDVVDVHGEPGWSNAVESAALEVASSRIRRRRRSCTLSGWASPWECRAAQSRQVRLREAHGPSWGTA